MARQTCRLSGACHPLTLTAERQGMQIAVYTTFPKIYHGYTRAVSNTPY